MNSPEQLPAEIRERSFSTSEAAELGVSRARTRRKDLLTASRGIRVPWGVQQDFASVVAPILKVTPRAVLCHGSAAKLWKLPIPGWVQSERQIHVAKLSPSSTVLRVGVRAHRLRLRASEMTELYGLAVTSPARTWLDLAGLLSFAELVAMGDAMVCQYQRSFGPARTALCSTSDLAQIIENHKGARSIRLARLALDAIRVGADSPPETYLRLALVDAGTPEPEMGLVIFDSSGTEIAWPDLAYRQYRISIQYDGGHHLSVEQQARDARRDLETARAGWITIKVTREMIRDRGYPGVAQMVRRLLIERGWKRSA